MLRDEWGILPQVIFENNLRSQFDLRQLQEMNSNYNPVKDVLAEYTFESCCYTKYSIVSIWGNMVKLEFEVWCNSKV